MRCNPAGSGGQMALFGKKLNFDLQQKTEMDEQMLGHIVCFRPRPVECVDRLSFCISRGERNGIQNRGRGTIPASVLELAELVEVPKERAFQAPFVAGDLA